MVLNKIVNINVQKENRVLFSEQNYFLYIGPIYIHLGWYLNQNWSRNQNIRSAGVGIESESESESFIKIVLESESES